MTPQELLANVQSAYGSCRTYQDRGDAVTVFIHSGGRRRTQSKPFRTWFIRPDQFRFEFAQREIGPEDEWDRYVIWRNAGITRSWWTINGPDEPESLSRALAGATGVSGCSAIRVPRLLLPELGVHERALRVEADQVVGGRPCKMLVEGQEAQEETWAIDAQTWMLLRVTARKIFDKSHHERAIRELERAKKDLEARGIHIPPPPRTEDFETETTTTYEPVLDADIPAEVFEFQPPR
jgi:hypothetical protein